MNDELISLLSSHGDKWYFIIGFAVGMLYAGVLSLIEVLINRFKERKKK